MKPVLFTTGCPQCKVLKAKLDQKNIEYTIEENLEEIIKEGFQSVPILKIEENYYLPFVAAVQWVNLQ